MLFAVLSEEGESSLSTATSRLSSIHLSELSPNVVQRILTAGTRLWSSRNCRRVRPRSTSCGKHRGGGGAGGSTGVGARLVSAAGRAYVAKQGGDQPDAFSQGRRAITAQIAAHNAAIRLVVTAP